MSDFDIKSFNEKLEKDADFKSDFETHQQMQESMDVFVEEDVRSVIASIQSSDLNSSSEETIEEEVPLSPQDKASKSRLRNLVIACVFGILALLFAMNYFNFGDDPSQNSIAYFVPYASEVQRSGNSTDDIFESHGKEINELVDNKEWQKASQKLKALVETTTGNYKDEAEWNWLVVTSQFDPTRAKVELEKILSNTKHLYYNDPAAKKFLKLLNQ